MMIFIYMLYHKINCLTSVYEASWSKNIHLWKTDGKCEDYNI